MKKVAKFIMAVVRLYAVVTSVPTQKKKIKKIERLS